MSHGDEEPAVMIEVPSNEAYREKPYIRFPQFLELLVRCALEIYDGKRGMENVHFHVPVVLALKCLFQKMSRRFQELTRNTKGHHTGTRKHPAYFIDGITRFSKTYVAMWKEDGSW